MPKSKSKLSLIIATACLVTTVSVTAFAFFVIPTGPAPTAAPPEKANAPLSADDFTKQVNTKAKQAQTDMINQTTGNLSQQTSLIPLPNKNAVTPPPAPNAKSSTTTPASATSQSSTASPEEVSGSSAVSGTEAPAPTTQAIAPAHSHASPALPANSQASPTQNQAQVYTGFQNGGSTTPASTGKSNTQSGSGWNIKY